MVQEQTNGSAPNGLEMGQSNQELVAKHKMRNWRVIAASAAILVLIVVLIIGVSVVWSRDSDAKRVFQPYRSLGGDVSVDMPDVLDGWYNAKGFNGTWISDSEILYRGSDIGHIQIYNLKTRSSRSLVRDENLVPPSTIEVEMSADGRFLLVAHSYQKLFRHTFLAKYDVVDLQTLSSTPIVNSLGLPDREVLQLAVWAPQGNGLVYVYRNNIIYKPSAGDQAEFPLTNNGIPGVIYNGVPDWVYEEEVFSSNKALWFSPDGRKLAFGTFNDTRVRVMSVPYYGPPGNFEFQYTKVVNIRYPKPGTPNPTVDLNVVNLDAVVQGTRDVQRILPPSDLINAEPLLTAVTWASDIAVSAVWMNRVQNSARVTVCDTEVAGVECREMLRQQEPAGWVDIFTPPTFSTRGERLVMILPHDVANFGAYKHATLVRPGKTTALTTGRFVVTEILAWDEDERLVSIDAMRQCADINRSSTLFPSFPSYFLGTEQGDPSKLHLYSVSDDESGAPHRPTCITCRTRIECLYNKASFSKNNTFYMLNCAGPDLPDVTLYTKRHELLDRWESNDEVRGALYGRVLPRPYRLEVDVPGGFKAQVKLMLPPDMDTSGRTKYPLLVNVYGGPDSFQVTQRFGVDWSTYLTVNRSFIYAAIDGRGSGLKGDRMLFAGYRRLGTVEIEDQISVTKYLQNNLSYIDKNRTAIWGWSYGGYSTSMVLANDFHNVFQCGIAVAPVTNWAYYDTVYTERYMGLPTVSDNLQGYTSADLNNKIENLRNKQFLLVHGTLDDNVHYQQSMMLSRVLETNDIMFRQQTYPDEEHGLGGVRTHLYHTLERFLDTCLRLVRY